MSNIGYKLRCLKNINYDKMIGVINNIHDKTNKNRFYLLMDMINCSNKYGTGYYDYQEFEFYNLNREERKTYLTRVKNNAIVKLLFLVKNTPTKIYPNILEKHLKIYINALNLPLKFSSTNLLGM